MSRAFLLVSTSALLILSTGAADSPLPHDALRLLEQRRATIANLDAILMQDLENVKQRCMKDGNLEAANAVAKLIKKPPPASTPGKLDPLAGSTWDFLGVDRQKINQITLYNSGKAKCEHSYPDATWRRLDNKTILFSYGTEGSYALLRFTDETKSYLSGTNVAGRSRHLKRVN